MTEIPRDPSLIPASTDESAGKAPSIVCPVCGAATVQEKCKVLCKSEVCRGRVIMNCAEF